MQDPPRVTKLIKSYHTARTSRLSAPPSSPRHFAPRKQSSPSPLETQTTVGGGGGGGAGVTVSAAAPVAAAAPSSSATEGAVAAAADAKAGRHASTTPRAPKKFTSRVSRIIPFPPTPSSSARHTPALLNNRSTLPPRWSSTQSLRKAARLSGQVTSRGWTEAGRSVVGASFGRCCCCRRSRNRSNAASPWCARANRKAPGQDALYRVCDGEGGVGGLHACGLASHLLWLIYPIFSSEHLWTLGSDCKLSLFYLLLPAQTADGWRKMYL